MDQRHLYIIQRLNKSDLPVSGTILSNELNVSSRSIRTFIKQINEQLNKDLAQIVSLPGSGYQLNIFNFIDFTKWMEEENRKTEQVNDINRQRWIMEYLCYEYDYLKIDQASQELYVSRSTISQDIKELKLILQSYHITLESRPNYGIYLSGEEYNIRRCMLQVFPNMGFSESWSQLIKDISNTYNILLRPEAIHSILQYIQIAQTRNVKGKWLKELPINIEFLQEEIEYQISEELSRHLSDNGLSLTVLDSAFLALLFIKYRVTSIENERLPKHDHSLYTLTVEIVSFLEKEFDLDINQDWRNRFIRHLLPCLKRAKYGISIQNELLQEIKKQYSLAFDLALKAMLLIKKKFGFDLSEDDGGYLALHFQDAKTQQPFSKLSVAIVCASGIGSAQILKRKIETIFNNEIEIIGVFDTNGLQSKIKQACHLILSTIPILEETCYPVITVNPLLPDQDQKKIKAFIQQNNQSLLRPNLFFRNVEIDSDIELITFLAQSIIQQGYAPDEFLPLTIKREKISSTAFGGMIALPHPFNPCGYENVIAIALLKKPILWGETKEKVQAVFLLSLKKDNEQEIQELYDRLLLIMDQPSLQTQINKQESFTDFVEFWNKLYTFHTPPSAT
ncbi:BglG family transcription antiterminator [Heyndrickxia oleronia]|jgi:lichenan operon transcriptional antiterminator|uniref:BglG family transcription antiterminator n=1 Tax=Heyndrickxia oleronia TaxID=38875 RepID=UPI00242B4944|nr:BglG family transcription antiterminator [Heyndrickxia oleronia]MCI1592365.1 BglG family transcription antiterminator [Heyndrickxia oleronia]MCI1613587.1 BglG family transcription antiterminator [Heyndrickxia oleronia]MCI1761415.1 BglG family transcription antiterminator [Heyndrickxia oleronia]